MKIVIILLLLLSCRDEKHLIKVEQIESNKFPVMIAYDPETYRVEVINFPLTYRISLNYRKNVRISNPAYYCNSINQKIDFYFWDAGAVLFGNISDSLIYFSHHNVNVLSTIPREYVVYTRHYDIDTSARVQNLFANYVSRMKTEGKDTLHIETISQLKQTNPELVYGFLQRDSIQMVFYYNKFFHSVYRAVEVK